MNKTSLIGLAIFTSTCAMTMLVPVALSQDGGIVPPEFIRDWLAGQDIWLRVLVMAASMAALAGILDLFGRASAATFTGRKGGAASKKAAIARLAAVGGLIAATALAMAFVPNAFPPIPAWKVICIFGTMLVPLALAVANLRKAAKSAASEGKAAKVEVRN